MKNEHQNVPKNDLNLFAIDELLAKTSCSWCLGGKPNGANDCGPWKDACRALYPEYNKDYVALPFEQF